MGGRQLSALPAQLWKGRERALSNSTRPSAWGRAARPSTEGFPPPSAAASRAARRSARMSAISASPCSRAPFCPSQRSSGASEESYR